MEVNSSPFETLMQQAVAHEIGQGVINRLSAETQLHLLKQELAAARAQVAELQANAEKSE